MSLATQPLSLNINGKDVGPIDVPEGLMMIDFLHEYLALTGSRLGCGQGICHACVVIHDKADGTSEQVRACITGAHYFQGKKVRTVEGHAKRNDKGEVVELSPVQQKFLEHFSFQCGYCTPGMIMSTADLLARNANPSESEIRNWLEGNICRCTGYQNIVKAVQVVAANSGSGV